MNTCHEKPVHRFILIRRIGTFFIVINIVFIIIISLFYVIFHFMLLLFFSVFFIIAILSSSTLSHCVCQTVFFLEYIYLITGDLRITILANREISKKYKLKSPRQKINVKKIHFARIS